MSLPLLARRVVLLGRRSASVFVVNHQAVRRISHLQANRERLGIESAYADKAAKYAERRSDGVHSWTVDEIHRAAVRKDWDAAYSLYQGVGDDAPPNLLVAVLRAADRCNRLAEAEEIFAQMATDVGRGLRIQAFTPLINLNGRKGDIARAQELLEQIRAEGLRPDAVIYCALLKGHAKQKDVDAARTLWQGMLDEGVRPTSLAFLAILNVFSVAGMPELVAEYIGQMSQYGLAPEVSHWNVLLKACWMANDADAAQREFDRMKASGVTPTLVSYTTMLGVYGEKDGADLQKEIDALLSDMETVGVVPDAYFFERCALGRLGIPTFRDAIVRLRQEAFDLEKLQSAASDLGKAEALGVELSMLSQRFREALEVALGQAQHASQTQTSNSSDAEHGVSRGHDDWVEVRSAANGSYFWNRTTGITQWDRPAAEAIEVMSAS